MWFFMQAAFTIAPLLLQIASRPGCRVAAPEVHQIARDTARVRMTITHTVPGTYELDPAKPSLVIDFTYTRDSTGWQRRPMTRTPTYNHAPCFIAQEWEHVQP